MKNYKQYISEIIEKLYLEYNYIGKETFDSIVLHSIDNLINNNGKVTDEKTSEIYLLIKTNIEEFLNKSHLYLKEINKYINEKLSLTQSYKEAIEQFNNFVKFIKNSNYQTSYYLYKKILNSNLLIRNTVEIIIDNNSKEFDDDISNDIIKVYNKIYNQKGELELDDSNYENLDDHNQMLKLYMDDINQFNLLTAEEEKKLGLRSKEGDKEAKRILIERNLRLVNIVANKYKRCGVYYLDLIQEGNIGLIEAVNRFDATLGYRFSTYAIWWIRKAIHDYIVERHRDIKLPVSLSLNINNYIKLKHNYYKENGSEPTAEEIIKYLNISEKTMKKIEQFGPYTISLDANLNDENLDITLKDYIIDENQDCSDSVNFNIFQKEVRNLLDESGLTKKEKEILLLRFGFDGVCRTFDEIGKIKGCSRQGAHILEQRALKKLRLSNKIKYFAVYMDNPENALETIKKERKKQYIKK